MEEKLTVLQFSLDRQRYAAELEAVVRVVPAVTVTRLSAAPAVVMGVLNLNGDIIPVLNTRERFSLPHREIRARDHFIIAKAGIRTVALVVDHVEGVLQYPRSDVICPDTIVPGIRNVHGVVRLEDGLLLIQDLEKFLSFEEQSMLDHCLETAP